MNKLRRNPSIGTMKRVELDGARTYRSDLDGDVAIVVRHGRVSSVGRGGDGVPPPRRLALPLGGQWVCDAASVGR